MTRPDVERTKYATLFVGPDGRELWQSGRHVGEEKVIPEGQRPFPDEERVYTKQKEVKVGDRKRDGDVAVFEAADIHEYEG